MSRKVVIVGGVAAGMSAATKIRRTDPSIEVRVYEAGEFSSYGACGLPYYVSGVMPDWRAMVIRTPERYRDEGIDMRMRHRVVKVYPEERRLLVKRLDSGESFMDSYDELVWAAGAAPIRPGVPGMDLQGVFTLGDIPDGRAIRAAALDPAVRSVVIVGGGFIGMELAESFVALGKKTTVLEKAQSILGVFDPEFSALAADEARRHGVDVRQGEGLVAVEGARRVESVRTDSSLGALEADLVVVAVGVRPSTAPLEEAERLANGALVVDERGRTSLPGVWAAGDAATVRHMITGLDTHVPLGTYANKAGRVVGENVAGGDAVMRPALGTSALRVLGLEIAKTGIGQSEAVRFGIEHRAVTVEAPNRATYYPDHDPLTVKLVYEPGSRRLLGAQIAGKKDAALRIDVFATAISAGLDCGRVGFLDLCYAPPFSAVWDAIHVAANAAK
ncbi:MAG: CoA-disulfide reductase [Spirochaetes bacterium]|nr:CoA-disulfide reductase [Spirochaetota bacterium]